MTSVLRAYMARMDSGRPEQALELLVPDFRFLIVLPTGEATGRSKDDFAAYIAGRNAVERAHEILRRSSDGDLETVYGVVTESGKTIGSFLSAAVVTPDGRMARYQSYFTTTYDLIDRQD
ncbi:nuclear transport factor 2 family protein [Streptomyces sp. NBC_00201]|uniref:nuclear transport factor 2 family protein n=1 Tax=unclassified Streptomyces TaxID=2593676 RepID=UPI0022518EEB|nr:MULTISPECIES: nuclear transport factor 2 family protein [unclassified Streptomyces]MCX5063237.1 nuclear transport factor 2 family protein [Streptomyces sp. NBC_00452]MCX5251077.1 nuclear transport factor 2 family protein [Streptomyces sp. NBC_00201]MCX5290994.1 nuclear transport factor 2 family protein [Streptomyces sp. NBC_00183]